ncbi:MAG: GGDEF domain-containing protein [Acholeplasmataceae bacterium]|nr:GGDEF domain-containing protein [Acholeplasmataceae bacterium]
MQHQVIKELKTRYDIDYTNDMLFQNPKHINFYFVLGESPMRFNVLYGDVTQIGFKKQDILYSKDILANIVLDNALAEVEGKNTYLLDLIHKVKTIDEDLYFYLPLNDHGKTIWLYTSLHKVLNTKFPLVFGKVIRIYDDTPDEITYYQKTYQDPLTRLFTRETLKKHFSVLKNEKDAYGIYFDIDGFKEINDELGHQEGDKFLIDLSNLFISNWEQNVIYYRLGGDEFFIYAYSHTRDEIIDRAKRLINDIETLNNMTKNLKVSASVGIVKINDTNKDYHDLLDQGDQLMYQSKRQGRGQITISD